MRIVVVGAGVVGLLTAVECARAGARVQLVEQGEIPNRLATSYDWIRVVRALHCDNPALTLTAGEALRAWSELERLIDDRLLYRIGALTALRPAGIGPAVDLLRAAGQPVRPVAPAELGAFGPVRFGTGLAAVLEPAAGVVPARRALAVLTGWLRRHRQVVLRSGQPVVAVDPDGVTLAGGCRLLADGIAVAAGPWSRELFPPSVTAGLRLYRQTVLSYPALPSPSAWTRAPAMPSLGTAQGAWLTPPVAGAPVRLSAAAACRSVDGFEPGVRSPEHWRALLVRQFADLLPDFQPALVGATDAFYLAEDGSGGPRLARIGVGNAWALVACGGQSFKLAPLIARALADRALGRGPTPVGLDAIDRPRIPTGPAGPTRREYAR